MRTRPAPRSAPMPAICSRASRAGDRRASCSAPIWTPCRRRRRSSRCSSTVAGRTPTRHPRGRQQGGGGRAARAGAPAAPAPGAAAGGHRAAVHGLARRTACTAPRRSTPPVCGARSATCSITPRRSARSSSPRRRYNRIVAELHGRAAHAGVRPEDGRSAIVAAARAIAAMRLGRLDPETTANVGTIAGRDGDQRRPRALPGGGRGARAGRAARGARSSPRWSTASRTPPTPASAIST